MKSAALVGVKINEFWDMTPFEFSLQAECYIDQKRADQEERLMLAYLGAYWQRVKKMPDIKKLISKKEEKPTDMLEEIKKINNMLGGNTY